MITPSPWQMGCDCIDKRHIKDNYIVLFQVFCFIFSPIEVQYYLRKYRYLHVPLVLKCWEQYGKDDECCCALAKYVYKGMQKEGEDIPIPSTPGKSKNHW